MRNPPKIIAVIPAKGHSRRLPGKNLRDLCGKPMLAWTIEAALASDLVTDVVVSTDDDMVVAAASEYDVGITMRPDCLSGDFISAMAPTAHAVEDYDADSIVVHLEPTYPMRTAVDVDGAISLFLTTPSADAVMTAKEMYLSPEHLLTIGNDGKINWHNQNQAKASQSVIHYVYDGVAFVTTVGFVGNIVSNGGDGCNNWLDKSYLFYGLSVSDVSATDVDNENDFDIATHLMEKRLKWLS